MRLVPLSSTTKTRRRGNSRSCGAGPLSLTGSLTTGAALSRMPNRNVLPSPGTLSTAIAPPMCSISRQLMASPRSMPPNLREIEPATWLNSWNSLGSASAGVPMPVSLTEIDSRTPSDSHGAKDTVTDTPPCTVNLRPLPIRLSGTCRGRAALLLCQRKHGVRARSDLSENFTLGRPSRRKCL